MQIMVEHHISHGTEDRTVPKSVFRFVSTSIWTNMLCCVFTFFSWQQLPIGAKLMQKFVFYPSTWMKSFYWPSCANGGAVLNDLRFIYINMHLKRARGKRLKRGDPLKIKLGGQMCHSHLSRLGSVRGFLLVHPVTLDAHHHIMADWPCHSVYRPSSLFCALLLMWKMPPSSEKTAARYWGIHANLFRGSESLPQFFVFWSF